MKEFKYKINGNEYVVIINNENEEIIELEVNGTPYKVELEKKQSTQRPIISRPQTTPSASRPTVKVDKPTKSEGQGATIKSPLPGVILDICVKEGDEVKRGQKVAVLEAMKMENNINADRDGKIVAVKVAKGDSILEGTDIVVIG